MRVQRIELIKHLFALLLCDIHLNLSLEYECDYDRLSLDKLVFKN